MKFLPTIVASVILFVAGNVAAQQINVVNSYGSRGDWDSAFSNYQEEGFDDQNLNAGLNKSGSGLIFQASTFNGFFNEAILGNSNTDTTWIFDSGISYIGAEWNLLYAGGDGTANSGAGSGLEIILDMGLENQTTIGEISRFSGSDTVSSQFDFFGFSTNISFTKVTIRAANQAPNAEFGESYTMTNIVYEPVTPSPVPEPTTLLLFGTGLAGIIGVKRRKK